MEKALMLGLLLRSTTLNPNLCSGILKLVGPDWSRPIYYDSIYTGTDLRSVAWAPDGTKFATVGSQIRDRTPTDEVNGLRPSNRLWCVVQVRSKKGHLLGRLALDLDMSTNYSIRWHQNSRSMTLRRVCTSDVWTLTLYGCQLLRDTTTPPLSHGQPVRDNKNPKGYWTAIITHLAGDCDILNNVGSRVARLPRRHDRYIDAAWSPDGQMIAVVGGPTILRMTAI